MVTLGVYTFENFENINNFKITCLVSGMKSVVFFLVTLAVLISVVAALPTFSFSGSTQVDQPNVGQYPGANLYDLPCTPFEEYDDDDYDFNYVAWNIWIDSSNSSYYFVKGKAVNITGLGEGDDYFDLYVYIYNTTFDPSNPCQGLYANGQFLNLVGSDQIDIFDGVNLVAGLYTIVVSSEDDQVTFGIEFSPVTTILPIWPGIGLPSYAESYGPAYFYFGENFNCTYVSTEDGNDDGDSGYLYNNFTWTQPTSGYFDIYAIAINSTYINPQLYDDDYYDIYISLYSGYLISNAIDFQTNPCQANFVNGNENGNIVTGLDYIWLNAGWNYTLVVSIEDDEFYGSVAIQVLPSNFLFINNASFLTPEIEYDDDNDVYECSTDYIDDDGGDDSIYLTGWGPLTITAQYPVFVVADLQPLNTDYWGSFDSYLLLYSGNLNGNPPVPCTNLLQIDSYSLGGPVNIGSNYTILITDDDDDGYSEPYTSSASHVFVFTGPYVNTASYVISPATIPSTSSSSSSLTSSSSSTSSTSTSALSTTTSASSTTTSALSTTTSASSTTTSASSTTTSALSTTTSASSTGKGTTGFVSETSTTGKGTTGFINGTLTTGKGTTGFVNGTTGFVNGTLTTGKGTTGFKNTTTGTGTASFNSSSHTFVSAFVFLLVTFALLF